MVLAVATAYRGDTAGSRAELETVAPDDVLAAALWCFAAADYDGLERRLSGAGAADAADPDRAALRSAMRALVQVECRGRVVVPVDETSVARDSPVAGLIGYLLTESAYSAGLLERAEAISRRVLERAGDTTTDPFLPWVRITRIRVLAFLGLTDLAADQLALLSPEVERWPLGPTLVASHESLVASVGGDVEAVLAAADRARAAAPCVPDQLGAMAVAMTGLALSVVGRPDLAMEALAAAGAELELVPLVSRCHVGDLAVDSCLRLGLVDEARRHLRRSESFDVEPGSFCSAAVERSRARIRALDDPRLPDAGPHAEMYLTRDRALADVAALPTSEADLEELTRLIAGAGLAAVRSWAGRDPGSEEATLGLFAGLGWDALPPQARVVARLAAAGLRNKEIAQAMFLSERTVESYVTTVLATIGARRRVGIGDRVLFHAPATDLPALTERQSEVAQLVAAGLGNHDIAERLGLSEKTVEKHVATLFRLLGVGSRSGVAALLRARG